MATQKLTTGRPCESRDPYAAAYRWDDVAAAFCSRLSRWLWVPAFAGTTLHLFSR